MYAKLAVASALGGAAGFILAAQACRLFCRGCGKKDGDEVSMFGPFDLNLLVRPNIAKLVPYRCARDDYDSGILLDANENTHGPPLDATEFANEIERYPSPYQWKLRQLYADWRGVEKENIFVGVGSDEAIDMLQRAVCTPKQDGILILPPTYGMYSVSAAVNDIYVDTFNLTPSFQFKAKDVLAAIKPRTKIVFICSPNNPTANDIDRNEIIALLDSGYRGLIVIDEAYIDFSDLESMASLVPTYPNLVVLQTFSKSWGMAGARCGVAIANEGLIETLNKMKAPYNMNKITSRLAVSAMENIDTLMQTVEKIKAERSRVMAALEALPHITKVFPSSTNYIMFSTPQAKKVYLQIAEAGVVIRFRGNCLHCEGCLRATVGTQSENDQMLKLLAEITERLAGESQ